MGSTQPLQMTWCSGFICPFDSMSKTTFHATLECVKRARPDVLIAMMRNVMPIDNEYHFAPFFLSIIDSDQDICREECKHHPFRDIFRRAYAKTRWTRHAKLQAMLLTGVTSKCGLSLKTDQCHPRGNWRQGDR